MAGLSPSSPQAVRGRLIGLTVARPAKTKGMLIDMLKIIMLHCVMGNAADPIQLPDLSL
jgi:hypothetical protein